MQDPANGMMRGMNEKTTPTLVFGIAFSMMFLGFFFFMIGVWHYSLPQAGMAVTPGPLLVMPTAIITGRLATRFGSLCEYVFA